MEPTDAGPGRISELRVVVTVADLDEVLRVYRDVLGLPELDVASPEGRIAILEAGRATIEFADEAHAAYVDEVEVGRRTAGHVRLALRVDDADLTARRVQDAGVTPVAGPTPTPWGSRNARFDAPGGLQLTLFGPASSAAASPGPEAPVR